MRLFRDFDTEKSWVDTLGEHLQSLHNLTACIEKKTPKPKGNVRVTSSKSCSSVTFKNIVLRILLC